MNSFSLKTRTLAVCLASACCLVFCEGTERTAKKPNIVLIVVDDLGARDTGYAGSSFYRTPNIDRLASQGAVFTQAYAAASICSPTRAALMTGKHPARLKITNWIPGLRPPGKELLEPAIQEHLPLAETTVAEFVQAAGYRTFFTGKWHLGGKGYHPDDQGFEKNIGGGEFGQPPGGYFSPYSNPQLTDGPPNEYLPDRMTAEAINFIGENTDNPFFVYLSYYTVHTPLHKVQKHMQSYQDELQSIERLDTTNLEQERGGFTRLAQTNPLYASMVTAMDDNIGRLLDALQSLNLDKNTLLIFTSDNGGLATLAPFHEHFQHGIPTSNLPLRAGKGWLYEGGVRVPLVIRWPTRIGEATISAPVVTMDLFETILEVTGVEQTGKSDGESLWPLLDGAGQGQQRDLFWHFPHYHGSGSIPSSALRSGSWKYIHFYGHGEELYDLEADPQERSNLIDRETDIANTMREKLEERLTEVHADLPMPNGTG